MDAKDVILTTTGIFNIAFGLINTTNNFKSAMLYKVIPFLTGLACMYAGWVIK